MNICSSCNCDITPFPLNTSYETPITIAVYNIPQPDGQCTDGGYSYCASGMIPNANGRGVGTENINVYADFGTSSILPFRLIISLNKNYGGNIGLFYCDLYANNYVVLSEPT
jgi:hypothetical protein